MFYDFHIHSCLSPCSDDDMTVNNIVNMALLKELDWIAITDHNSFGQLATLEKVSKNKIGVLYGAELESAEEIHVLALFQKIEDALEIKEIVNKALVKEFNDPNYFGHQYIRNEFDEVIDEEEYLLIKSLELNLKQVIELIHKHHGIAVLAHIYSGRYGIGNHYKRIPSDLEFDGIEVKDELEKRRFQQEYPDLHPLVFIDSDAHRLEDISEREHEIEMDEVEKRFVRWKN